MSIEQELLNGSESSCELCKSTTDLSVYEVSPSDGSAEQSVLLCSKCKEQFEDESKIDANHWFCLNDSMWSTIPAVQVVSYRMPKKIGNQDLLDMMYLEDDVKAWVDAGISSRKLDNSIVHRDLNGVILQGGDTVTIIKDLEVKGAGFTAKRVNGGKIVLLTCFLKKS